MTTMISRCNKEREKGEAFLNSHRADEWINNQSHVVEREKREEKTRSAATLDDCCVDDPAICRGGRFLLYLMARRCHPTRSSDCKIYPRGFFIRPTMSFFRHKTLIDLSNNQYCSITYVWTFLKGAANKPPTSTTGAFWIGKRTMRTHERSESGLWGARMEKKE
jgi:hypothetical protein